MANTSYSIPVGSAAARERAQDVLVGVGGHLIAWREIYNIDLVSIVVQGANLVFTFSNPVPIEEQRHIRISVS
jgi:hypothetical protein